MSVFSLAQELLFPSVIPNSRTKLPLFYLALLLARAYGTGNGNIWALSEPVWPGDEIGKIWQAYSNIAEKHKGFTSWPITLGEICADVPEAESEQAPSSQTDDALLRSACFGKTHIRPLSVTADLGSYMPNRVYPFGRTFERYSEGWTSILVQPENGKAWSELPSTIESELSYPINAMGFLHFRLCLRRDLSAWFRDDLGLNAPLSEKEVDLNEPSLGYFHLENNRFAFTIGRFPVHWSPSAHFGLALSHAVPYHNGAEFALKMPKVRYRFLASSLNPWLEGTPLGNSSSEEYPPGSEEYRQRHYPDDNGAGSFHKRVYAERIKTLFAHRLEADWGPVGLGVTETQVIGGKAPDLRDAGPFVFFHNDFKDGYTNIALSLDIAFRLPAGFSMTGEIYMDDLQYGATEGVGKTASLLGYLAGIRHDFSARKWLFTHSAHMVRTDPFLYGYLQPLNTMASRHILVSNNQRDSDADFTDHFVIDYPMGYLRGGDAYDFWYQLEGWRGPLRLSVMAALLAKGEVTLHTPYPEYYSSSHDSPTGVTEGEMRLRLDAGYRLHGGAILHGGAAWQAVRNAGNESGRNMERVRISLGVSGTLP